MTLEIGLAVLNLAGLSLTTIGAVVAALSVIITEEQVENISGTYWDDNSALKAALLQQSRSARNGLLCVAAGTMFQAAAIAIPMLA